jgi:hypothetical protein
MRVRLTTASDDAIAMQSPYDADFVHRLKGWIPWDGRRWDPDKKMWMISTLYSADLLTLLQQVGAQVQDDRDTVASGVPPPPMPDDLRWAFDALFLQYHAPLCVAEGAYRQLAQYWHPDKGGSADDFHAVGDAIAIIRRYLDPKEITDDDVPPF